MKKLVRLLSLPAVAILAIIGFKPTGSDAQSQQIEDTWFEVFGNCEGNPTDCLDTLVIDTEY